MVKKRRNKGQGRRKAKEGRATAKKSRQQEQRARQNQGPPNSRLRTISRWSFFLVPVFGGAWFVYDEIWPKPLKIDENVGAIPTPLLGVPFSITNVNRFFDAEIGDVNCIVDFVSGQRYQAWFGFSSIIPLNERLQPDETKNIVCPLRSNDRVGYGKVTIKAEYRTILPFIEPEAKQVFTWNQTLGRWIKGT